MSDAKPKEDWSKPAAMAIEKGGYIGEPQRGRFTTCRGGEYFFLPGLKGLRHLAALGG
jgi:hypothetical protein